MPALHPSRHADHGDQPMTGGVHQLDCQLDVWQGATASFAPVATPGVTSIVAIGLSLAPAARIDRVAHPPPRASDRQAFWQVFVI
jgi:hypothetical protein